MYQVQYRFSQNVPYQFTFYLHAMTTTAATELLQQQTTTSTTVTPTVTAAVIIAITATTTTVMIATCVGLWPVLVLVDVSHIWHQSRLDPEILKLLQLHINKPSILVLNKVPSNVSLCVCVSFKVKKNSFSSYAHRAALIFVLLIYNQTSVYTDAASL